MDYDNDGIQDFISGSYDPGDVYLFRGIGEGKYAAGETIVDENDVPLVHHPVELAKYNELHKDGESDDDAATSARVASFGSWPATVDWDADGDLDMLIGSFGGNMFLRLNIGTREKPVYSGESINVKVGTQSMKVSCHANPVVADWNNDGIWDLIVSCGNGSVSWFENIGSEGKPEFATPQILVEPAANQKFLEQNLASDEEPKPAVRAQICVTDFNRDGLLDLIVGDYSEVNWTRDLSEEESAEFEALKTELENVLTPLPAIRNEMNRDDIDEDAKAEKEQEYENLIQNYTDLQEKKKAFYKESRSASFIWLYLRQPVDSNPESGNNKVSFIHENKNVGPKDPVTIEATVAKVKSDSGANFEVTVQMEIETGWHIYAEVPKIYASPVTEIKLELPEGVTAVGEWQKPQGHPDLKIPKIIVYDGSVTFVQELNVADGVGEITIPIKIEYQACTDQHCLPPKTHETSITLPTFEADKLETDDRPANNYFENPVRLMLGDQPMNVKEELNYPSPVMMDIDGDAKPELVMGDIWGGLLVYENSNSDTKSEPVWGEPIALNSTDSAPIAVSNW